MDDTEICYKLGLNDLDELNKVLKANDVEERIVDFLEKRYFKLKPLNEDKIFKISERINSKNIESNSLDRKWGIDLQNNLFKIINLCFSIDFSGKNSRHSETLHLDNGHLFSKKFKDFIKINVIGCWSFCTKWL